VLEGIVFVLRTGIPWASLPKAMGCGSGMTCWRRLRDWQEAGVFERLHRTLLDRLGRANAIDFSRCSLDSASFPAKKGASASARTRPTVANPAPSATSWYDYDCCRRAARRRGIVPRIARRGIESSERLGRHRWVVERTLAWFVRFRRLTIRYERRLDILLGFHLLAAGLICFGFAERWGC